MGDAGANQAERQNQPGTAQAEQNPLVVLADVAINVFPLDPLLRAPLLYEC